MRKQTGPGARLVTGSRLRSNFQSLLISSGKKHLPASVVVTAAPQRSLLNPAVGSSHLISSLLIMRRRLFEAAGQKHETKYLIMRSSDCSLFYTGLPSVVLYLNISPEEGLYTDEIKMFD